MENPGKHDPYDLIRDDWQSLSDDDLLAYSGDLHWAWNAISYKLDHGAEGEWPTQAAYDADQASEESYLLHYSMVKEECKKRGLLKAQSQLDDLNKPTGG